MARQQIVTSGATRTGTGATVLSVSSIKCTSVIIQALVGNSDFVAIGDVTSQLFRLSPGQSIEINGDSLDHGVDGYIDLSQIYFNPVVAGEGVTYTYLAGY